MRRLVPVLLLLVVALSGCGDDSPAAEPPGRFAADVRENFLDSCVQNAEKASAGAATVEQLTRTCECILGKVEQEYSEAEFTQFEQRLVGGTASEQETDRLTQWSAECGEESTR